MPTGSWTMMELHHFSCLGVVILGDTLAVVGKLTDLKPFPIKTAVWSIPSLRLEILVAGAKFDRPAFALEAAILPTADSDEDLVRVSRQLFKHELLPCIIIHTLGNVHTVLIAWTLFLTMPAISYSAGRLWFTADHRHEMLDNTNLYEY